VNEEFGDVDAKVTKAIKEAAKEVIEGKFDREFVIDIFQTGSGTSTNMNANEVIANRAIEILGGKRGDRNLVHPNDHVNNGMSSNDAIPTAIHIAALLDIKENLLPALVKLEKSFSAKSKEFWGVIKTGRTHLQDATPIRLGQEFLGYAGQIERAVIRLQHAESRLSEVALGGTAVGTGINTRKEFAGKVLAIINKHTGLNLQESSNHFQAQSTLDEVVDASGVLKTLAVSLMKIANDIRWLGCGPRAGIAEIALPEVQPGSSIMPGKVNPVIAEAVCMVAAQVIGNDATVTIAGQSGNFELNVMQPVAAYNLLQSINLLATVTDNFRQKCVDGLKATENGPHLVERGLALCTALVPEIGYDLSAQCSHDAFASGETIRQVAKKKTKLTDKDLERLLDPFKMTEPGLE
jgi:fumarate hydratase class II